MAVGAHRPGDPEPVKDCTCGCCADARERIRCGAAGMFLSYACWCDQYGPDEQCDCAFCRVMLAGVPRN